MRRKSRAIWIPLIVFTATAFACRKPEEDSVKKSPSRNNSSGIVQLDDQTQKQIGLTVQTINLQEISETFSATGKIGPNETKETEVRLLSRGRVRRVFVRTGDRVRSGEPLLSYDNTELGDLIGEYRKASAEEETAKRALERAQKLVDIGGLAQSEFDRRNTEHENALASLNAAAQKIRSFGLTEKELARIKAGVDSGGQIPQTILRAPFDGVVLKSDVAEGAVPDTDQSLFTIANLATVWVQADVHEKDIGLLREGMPSKIVVPAYPGEFFSGTVAYVGDQVDPETRTVKVRCEVPNPDGHLKLDMFADVRISIKPAGRALLVPSRAVQKEGDLSYLFVRMEPNEFKKTPVEPGRSFEDSVEIRKGLNPGQQVVVDGAFILKSELAKGTLEADHD